MTLRSDVTIVVATIDQPQAAIRLVQSIRQRYPNICILVGEQISDPDTSILKSIDADVLFFPYDHGVAATRNDLVSRVLTEYFILCCDDFIFGKRTDYTPAIEILDNHKTIGVVGGLLFDIYDNDDLNEMAPIYFEKWININEDRKSMLLIPIAYELPEYYYLNNWRYLYADTVLDWAVMRTCLFHNGALGWDVRFKAAGEREDFYLQRKLTAPHVKVVYCPDLVAYRNQASGRYGDNYQDHSRLSGWADFRRKWNIDRVIDVSQAGGYCINTIDAMVYSAAISYHDFIGQLNEREKWIDPNAVDFDVNGRLYCRSFWPESASRRDRSDLFLCERTGEFHVVRSADGEQEAEAARAQLETRLQEAEAARAQLETRLQEAEAARAQLETRLQEAEAARAQLETRLQEAEARARATEVFLRHATESRNELIRENGYLKDRTAWERLFFRTSGKPIKLLRRVLFHNNGKPRGLFRKYVLDSAVRPSGALHYWMTSPAYLALPRAVQPAPQTEEDAVWLQPIWYSLIDVDASDEADLDALMERIRAEVAVAKQVVQV
jgi:hypothetical protein